MAETVLIADGKGSRRRRLKTLLSALGYRVLAAGSGAAALALAETARLRVVLMAARLPDMPAESLLRAIRERSRDATQLVLCEGPGEVSRLKHAADGFLLPPLHADALEVILRGACEREALRRRLREQPVRIERRLEKRFRQRLETERLLVVKQIVDKISTFIGRIARDVEGGVRYFNEMPYFVSIHDRQARVLAASRPYRMLLGAHAGDGSGSIYEGESGESGGCPVGRTLATANAQQSREVVRYRSGAKVPVIVHTAPIYNDNGEVELVLEVSAGTQDVKRLREDTQNTQQRYQLLFDAVPCYLAVLDRSLVFSANNRAFIHEFGNRTGTAFRDVFYLDDEAFLASPVHKTLTDAQSRHGEMTLVGPNGRRYHLLVWTSPISTAAGKLMQVLLIFLDITQIRELQSNLASLGLMIGSISHSIKGVLTGLDAGVYLLDKGFQKRDDAQIESGLDVVRRMVNRMRKMILDILFCARERELQRTTVDDPGVCRRPGGNRPAQVRRQGHPAGVRLQRPAGLLRGRCRHAAVGGRQRAGECRRRLRRPGPLPRAPGGVADRGRRRHGGHHGGGQRHRHERRTAAEPLHHFFLDQGQPGHRSGAFPHRPDHPPARRADRRGVQAGPWLELPHDAAAPSRGQGAKGIGHRA